MHMNELEDVIAQVERLEDDVLRSIEDDPRLIKSKSMVDVLMQLKIALASMRVVRRKLDQFRISGEMLR